MTEDAKTVGDNSQTEDGGDESTSLSEPSEEQTMGKVEADEGKPEVTAAKPQRRASTPPPPNLPVKLLTRLGSLDGEFTRQTHVSQRYLTTALSHFSSRCSSCASQKVPSHLTQKLHTSQRPSWLSAERQDLYTNWVPPPWSAASTASSQLHH